VLIAQAVFLLECGHTHIHTHRNADATYHSSVGVGNDRKKPLNSMLYSVQNCYVVTPSSTLEWWHDCDKTICLAPTMSHKRLRENKLNSRRFTVLTNQPQKRATTQYSNKNELLFLQHSTKHSHTHCENNQQHVPTFDVSNSARLLLSSETAGATNNSRLLQRTTSNQELEYT